jgi:hypothetical protein
VASSSSARNGRPRGSRLSFTSSCRRTGQSPSGCSRMVRHWPTSLLRSHSAGRNATLRRNQRSTNEKSGQKRHQKELEELTNNFARTSRRTPISASNRSGKASTSQRRNVYRLGHDDHAIPPSPGRRGSPDRVAARAAHPARAPGTSPCTVRRVDRDRGQLPAARWGPRKNDYSVRERRA